MARPKSSQAAPASEPVSAPDTAPISQAPDPNRKVAPFEFKPEYDPYFDDPPEGDVDRGDFVEPDEPASTPDPAPMPDPTPDPTPEPEPEPEADAPRIPKARFDEVNEERKRLRAEVERLRAEMQTRPPEAPPEPVTPAYDFESKEKEYMEAVLDGDTDKALALRREIRQAEFDTIQAQVQKAVPRADEAATVVQQRMANESALKEVNTAFPVFDPNSEAYDVDLTEEAVAIARGFIEYRGMDFPSAIRKAADQVARLNGINRAGATPTAQPKPVADPKAVQQKLQQAARQPPTTPVNSIPDEDSVDVASMSDEEFMALPAKTRARLRGDFV